MTDRTRAAFVRRSRQAITNMDKAANDAAPGQTWGVEDLAEITGYTHQNICLIQSGALRKMRESALLQQYIEDTRG